MSVSVSVVVPVYNPGKHLEPCIDSLLRQSMPADRLELIFVDDGSTDESPERLDRLAAEHPHVRVIHEEASGWAGKPRNTGMQVATGEYVQFVDQDDWLGDEALERLHAYAVANDADVVLGKMVGVGGRTVPKQLYRANVPHATLASTSLMDSLTPHKMFRRAFLLEHDLTFPEGRRRLEDHVFVVSAYLHARGISVLSDYPCYFHTARGDGGNAGFRPLEPVGYFRDLRDALDAVEALTEPGALRDRLHRRWLRVEMVGRLRGAGLLRADAGYRAELLQEIRKVMAEYFSPGVAAGLAPAQRLVAELAREGDLDGLLALARWETTTAARATLERLEWDGDSLRVTVGATLVNADGTPVALQNGHLVAPLPGATLAGLCPDALDFSGGTTLVDLSLRHRGSGDERFLATAKTATGGDTAVDGTVEAVVSAATVGGEDPLARGIWDVWVKLRAYGWERATRVGLYRAQGVADAVRPALVGSPPAVVTPYWTEPGNLALDVAQSTRRTAIALTPDLGRSSVRASGSGWVVAVQLPLQLHTPVPASLRLTRDGRHPQAVTGAARLVPDAPGTATLHADVDPGAVGPGRWRLEVRLVDGGPCVPLGVALERHRGRPPVLAPVPEPVERTPSAASLWARRAARGARHTLQPWARAGVRRLPPGLRRPAKGVAHRLTRALH